MSDVYLQILNEWEKTVANIQIYENLDMFFPSLQLRRLNPGTSKDRWVSRFKLDGSIPKHKNAEKSVIHRTDFQFREQGEYENGVFMMSKYQKDNNLPSLFKAYSNAADLLHLEIPRPDSELVCAKERQNKFDYALLATLNDFFVSNLLNGYTTKVSSVRSYLKKKRGFTDEQISQLSFGFVPSWDIVERYITMEKKFRKEDLDRLCQVRNEELKTSVGKYNILSIPYVCGGVLKGFLFRRIDSDGYPKYIANTSLDRKSVFFNMPAAAEDIIVVEGELDALKLTSSGIPGCVAIGGSDVSGERRKQLEDAFRRGVKRIFLCLDLDPTGDDPSKGDATARHRHIMKTIHTIKDVNPDFDAIYITLLPYPCDPDEFVRENGSAAFVDLLRGSKPYWRYVCDYFEQM